MGQGCGHCCSSMATTASWLHPVHPTVGSLVDHRDDYAATAVYKWPDDPAAGFCGRWSKPPEEPIGSLHIDAKRYNLSPLSLGGSHHIFDINLHDGEMSQANVSNYYRLCKDHLGLHVTTSCFTAWRKSKKANGFSKVIPAITATEDDRTRIFFFDDNLEWDGLQDSSGICNLRDAKTGEFIAFTEGQNGFFRDTAARHTVIYHSTKYRNVLVKANILDAMEDPDYFSNIIKRFSSPSDKLIVFMDVNSTIVCNDTVQAKDLTNTLLSTMFEFVEFRPRASMQLHFDGNTPISIDKKKTMKQLVKDMTSSDRDAYASFWTPERCWRLYTELEAKGDVTWSGQKDPFPLKACQDLFDNYLASLPKVITRDGIAGSWFRMYDSLQGRHTIVLNSFGVDTRKVVLATVPDERRVLHLTVNYELWDERDKRTFSEQFPRPT
mmetsp:Transcript_13796/g.39721  ORF Transcript_13796/g.39721 Transcript_13796/m.39721 type:complete len:437 (+) Transcript_13796:91-1401(+)